MTRWCLHSGQTYVGIRVCCGSCRIKSSISLRLLMTLISFGTWNFNEVMGDSERAVGRMESSFGMRNVGFSVFLTCVLPSFMRNAILLGRWHGVKMVDSCSRVNGVLYIVARKSFESFIAWGVDELHQTFLFEQFFNGKLCCKIHDLLSVPIIFFWIGLLGAISRWMSD